MNIELRQWYFGDEEALINLYNNYDRSFYNGFPDPGTCSKSTANLDIRKYVDMLYDKCGYARAVVLDGMVVGHVQITKRKDIFDANCDFEIILLPEACNKGVGTWVLKEITDYAFNGPLNFERLFVTFFEKNNAAARMCEKAGLKLAGYEDGYFTLNGEPCKRAVYGIKRPMRESLNTGVELKPWAARDIVNLAHLYETVDKRYDDLADPLAEAKWWYAKSNDDEPSTEYLQERMIYKMREYVDSWNVNERAGGDIYRAIVNDGKIVGLICVCPKYGKYSLDCTLGYMMMPEYCGKGIATKAVHLMVDEVFSTRAELHRVSAWVYAPNEASKRVLQKNGFRLEGVLKEAVMCEGEPVDYLVYGLIRKDFHNAMAPNQTKMES